MKIIPLRKQFKLSSKLKLKDNFGHFMFVKGFLMAVIGGLTYFRFRKMEISGLEHLDDLPHSNVLFVSNHHTYYTDVIAFYQVFSATKWNFKNLSNPLYLLNPKVRSYFIAAEETMTESGLIPKIFAFAGAITIRRSWKHKNETINRKLDIKADEKIKKALDFGWVVTFPQGTVKPDAPIRKGAAHLIKLHQPIIIPIHINGFREAFDKTGLKIRKKGVKLSISFDKPIQFNSDASIEQIYNFLDATIRAHKKISNIEGEGYSDYVNTNKGQVSMTA